MKLMKKKLTMNGLSDRNKNWYKVRTHDCAN